MCGELFAANPLVNGRRALQMNHIQLTVIPPFSLSQQPNKIRPCGTGSNKARDSICAASIERAGITEARPKAVDQMPRRSEHRLVLAAAIPDQMAFSPVALLKTFKVIFFVRSLGLIRTRATLPPPSGPSAKAPFTGRNLSGFS